MATNVADARGIGRKWRVGEAPPAPAVELACAGGGDTHMATLVDVSTYGCRVRGEGIQEASDHVRLGFGRGPAVPATVVWRQGDVIGCRFDRPIATRLMRELICGAD